MRTADAEVRMMLIPAFVVFVAFMLLLVAVGTRAGNPRDTASPFVPKTPPAPALTSCTEATVRPSTSPKRENFAEKLRSIDWFQFEKLMELVYRKQGFEVDRRGGANPDGGIDLVLMKGAEKAAVQCKQWRKRDVAVRQVRELVGAMADEKISKGIFVTISDYTDYAKALADRNGIELVNHSALVRMLDSVDAAYDPEIQGLLNDTRKICPKCEREMELKTATRGKNVGSQFWSCTGFPNYCRHKQDC
jgi:restriction system protein